MSKKVTLTFDNFKNYLSLNPTSHLQLSNKKPWKRLCLNVEYITPLYGFVHIVGLRNMVFFFFKKIKNEQKLEHTS